jgi:nucleotide-binding universal stress UspA family protein
MYQRILVPIDGSATSTKGLDEAIKLAKLTGASLRLIHVVDELTFATGFETYDTFANDVIPLMKEAGETILEHGRARAAAAGVGVDTRLFETLAARLSEVVVEQVKDWNADLVVIGTHGRRGVDRLFLGSDAEQIVRTAPVPVLLVRAPLGKRDAPP